MSTDDDLLAAGSIISFPFSVVQLNHFLLKSLSSSEWDLRAQLDFLTSIASVGWTKRSGILFGTPSILPQVLHHLIEYNPHLGGWWSSLQILPLP